MKVYYFPVNGSVKVIAESYDKAINKASEKVLKGNFEYEFGEESVFDLEEDDDEE